MKSHLKENNKPTTRDSEGRGKAHVNNDTRGMTQRVSRRLTKTSSNQEPQRQNQDTTVVMNEESVGANTNTEVEEVSLTNTEDNAESKKM